MMVSHISDPVRVTGKYKPKNVRLWHALTLEGLWARAITVTVIATVTITVTITITVSITVTVTVTVTVNVTPAILYKPYG